jgi:hypothetical protein
VSSSHKKVFWQMWIADVVDVWSIGCIFAELMLGRPLFKGKE